MRTYLALWHMHPYLVTASTVVVVAPFLAAFFKSMETMFEAVAEFMLGLVFVRKELDDLYSVRIITDYLNDKCRGYGISTERYEANFKHIKTIEQYRNVFYRMHWGTWRIWFFRRRPIMLIPGGGSSGDDKSALVFIRGTINWEKLVIDAAKLRDDRLADFKDTTRRFKIRRHVGSHKTMTLSKANETSAPESKQEKHQLIANDVGEPLFWSRDEIGPPQPDNPLELLAINVGLQRVIDNVKFWHSHREWHKKRGIDWKLGILLFGEPGVGKTSIIRALCEDLDIPIHFFDLGSMDTSDFNGAWVESQQDKPRAVVFEDLDTVFNLRENITKQGDLSFQTVLNAVDGVEREDGLLFFVTTNKVETIDPALGAPDPEKKTEEGDPMSTRPSRIDIVVELKGLDREGRIKLGNRILQDESLAIFMAEEYSTDSAAQFQERCKQAAKKQLWQQAPGG